MLEENVVSSKPRFHFMADKNDVSSIVVELDYPVDISEVSRVMEKPAAHLRRTADAL